MNYKLLISAFICVSTLMFLTLLGDPLDLFMFDMGVMVVLALFAAATLAFGALVWQEGKGDEREMEHRSRAARFAYLIGSGILSIGIIAEALSHSLGPWLPGALGAMVLTKLAAHLYYERLQ
jgi:hypothetical protein